MDGFLGEIRAFAFNFAPRGWIQCDGSLLSIAQYSALFSILGVSFGGNGTTNFALPNYGGAAALGQGQGPGLSAYAVGEAVGSETVKLSAPEMPMHAHFLQGKVLTGVSSVLRNVPSSATSLSRLLTSGGTNQAGYVKAPLTQPTPMAAGVIGNAGASAPHENRQPLLTLMVCVCTGGVYPSRS